MKRKILALLLATAVIFTLLAACTQPDAADEPVAPPQNPNEPVNPNEPASPSDEPGETASAEPNEWGWVVPAETLEITVWGGQADPVAFEEDETGGRAVMDAWLLENLNVKINWIVNSNDRTEQLNLMLADGSYPEVLTAVPDLMADTFASQGRLVDLAPYMDTNLSNISRRVGDLMGLLYDNEGHLYKLPNMWGEQPDAVGTDFGIRYDMWLETGLPMYETPEQYYEALKAVLELYPTNESGEKTYAISNIGQDVNNLAFLRPMLWAYGLTPDFYKKNADDSFTYYLFTEEGKETGLFVNKMWREGMIDPDYQSRTYDDYIALLANERVIGNLGTWWHAFVGGHETWIGDDPNLPIEKRFMNGAVTAGGISYDETFLFQSNFLRTDRAIITDKCEQVEAVLNFIDWMNTELGNMVMGWGVPGGDNFWYIDDEGNWKIKDEVIVNMNVDKNTYFHTPREAHGAICYPIAICRGTMHSDGRSDFSKLDNRVVLASIYDFWPWNPDTGGYLDEGVNINWGNYKAPARDVLVYATAWNPDEQVTINRESVIADNNTWWANIVTANSEEACLQAIENAKAAAEALGIRDIEAEYARQYAEKAAKLG